jgi:hypothetical protein
MKKLTETQRKWALTACLASVLSFNMVLSLTGSSYGYASFASNEPRYESMISNKGEKLEVKYVAGEDGKTLAYVPEKLESGWCYQCGEKYLLPKNFDSSTTSLEAALRKAMYDNQGAKTEEIAKDKSEGEDLDVKPAKKIAEKKEKPRARAEEDDQQEEDKADPDFVALRDRCDKRDDDQAKLRCYTSGLTKLLKNKKKVYDRAEVMDLYRSEIEPGLRAALADISDLVPNNRASRFDMSDKEDSNRREEAKGLIEDMLAQITGKYNFLRERLTKLAANSVLKNQDVAQQKLKQADQLKNTNPAAALRLQNEGYARLSAANQVANDLGGSLYDGLDSAQWSNYVTGDQFEGMYYNNYANVVNDAIRGLTQNPLTYVLPNVTLADGTTIVDQNGQTYTVTPANVGRNSAIQSNGRSITVMMNNLTPANVVNTATPRLATNNGQQQGTASIQVIQGVTAPVNQTTLPAIRSGRGY